jgi:hypothetical protein
MVLLKSRDFSKSNRQPSDPEQSLTCKIGVHRSNSDVGTIMIYTHQTDEHLKRSIGKIDTR